MKKIGMASRFGSKGRWKVEMEALGCWGLWALGPDSKLDLRGRRKKLDKR